MAAFDYVWGTGGLDDNQPAGAANLSQLDKNVTKAINGDEGGAWAPEPDPIMIGGTKGLWVGAPFRADDATVIVVKTGGTVTFDVGSTLTVNGAFLIQNLQVNGTLGVVGDTSLGAGVTAAGNATIGGMLSVTGPAIVNGSKLAIAGPQPVPADTPDPNALYATNTPKAWARIKCAAGTVAVDDGFNIGGVLFTGGGTGISVSFNTPFATNEYAPLVSFQGQMGVPRIEIITESVVVLEHYNMMAGALFDLTSTNVVFTLAVFGRQ